MRVRLTRPANRDLAEALESVRSESPSGAAGLVRRFEDVTRRLRDFPKLGKPTDEEGIRRVNLQPFAYIMLYEIVGDTIVVHAIRHGARHPDELRTGARAR